MSGNLPPGTRDADIDRAAPGYDDPPFYCVMFESRGRMHCAHFSHGQCKECGRIEHEVEAGIYEQHEFIR